MVFKRILFCTLLVVASAIGFATEDYKKAFEKITALKVECSYCHLGTPPKRNPFGKALEDALDNSDDGLITAAMVAALDPADSDGDGVVNGDEIAAKTMPGDAKSKPASPAPGPAGPAESKKEEKGPLVPEHSFHPALVHFPVALLIVAAAFEIVGRKKNDDGLHSASVLCNGVGLIGSLFATISGVLFWLRAGFTLEGTLLIHLILAVLSTIVGVVAYVYRSKPAYVVIITLSALLVGAAGHFGGEMVYG
ncbi:MAG TPA: DUF2231 domain-containing protein [Fimbriimonas sp.]|nr:DUF2231 domain-containing protein [Fimbriimonas sp.]